MRTTLLLLLFLFLGAGIQAQNSNVLAFPEAEGFGKYTTGGRGGKVFIVTNLNDRGPGSLREALEAQGPRTVVFEVSGNIELESVLRVRSSDLTIAGQTAPGDGITLKNYPLKIRGYDNIIIRYLRVRMGDTKGLEDDAFEAQFCNGLIIDHCSFSWGTDETLSMYNVENVTLQYSIISEGLHDSVHEKGPHGYGGLLGGAKVSYFRNLIAHFWIRMPSRTDLGNVHGIVDLSENVIYNWGMRATDNGFNTITNIYRNYYKPGPTSFERNSRTTYFLNPTMLNNDPNTYGKFYLEGNFMPTIDLSNDQWRGVTLENQNNTQLYIDLLKNRDSSGNLAPFNMPSNLYNNTLEAVEAYNLVLNNAGANFAQDAVDKRVLQEVKTGTHTYRGSKTGFAGIIDSQADVGGWPELKSLPAPEDTDRDGMPDEWEIKNGLNPNEPDHNGNDLHPNYTNLEVYINSLVAERTDSEEEEKYQIQVSAEPKEGGKVSIKYDN
jgi:pectate lyase